MTSGVNNWLADLYRRHHRDLVRYASRLVGDRSDGEEVVQNTYLRLAGRSVHSAVVTMPLAYIYVAARNAAIDFTAQRRSEWLHRVDLPEVESHLAGEDPIVQLERRRRIIKLAVLLNELPENCRTAFILNKIEGRRHREIAEQMGISISMVEKHLIRALTHLRDLTRDELS